jgi:hypothetical protein
MLSIVDIDRNSRSTEMPRYIVERDFPAGLPITADAAGLAACREVVERNAEDNVTWLHSYVTSDGCRTYCIYDAPTPESLRRVAARNRLPVSRIVEVRDLSPYFHR